MNRFVVLRTHGGVGNQLFQILYGRLYAEENELQLTEVHDTRYPHAFPRSTLIHNAPVPNAYQKTISLTRSPKVFQRFFGRKENPLKFGKTTYIDGYFQARENYTSFAEESISQHLNRLRAELSIEPANIKTKLVHLRMGDFFKDRAAAKKHVLERFSTIAEGSHIMTNDELLLEDIDVVNFIKSKNLVLLTTGGASAEEVLRLMSRYKYIDANDSTLTFWSSVLGGSHVTFKNEKLRKCREYLLDCLSNR